MASSRLSRISVGATMTKVQVLFVLVLVATVVFVYLLLVENPLLDQLTAAAPESKEKAAKADTTATNASAAASYQLLRNHTIVSSGFSSVAPTPAIAHPPPDASHREGEPSTEKSSSNNRQSVTIVCQLSGELGNNLAKYAHCYAVSKLLFRNYRLPSRIMLRHQLHSKWVRGDHDAHLCFPHLRPLSFSEGNTDEFDIRAKEQEEFLGDGTTIMNNVYYGINSLDPQVVERALSVFVNHTRRIRGGDGISSALRVTQNNTTADPPPSNISVPFLYGNFFALQDIFVDQTIEDLREIFDFDRANKECCQIVPDPDESVFHLRNFLVEMPRAGKGLGFEELGPEQTARDLFGHLQLGDKVAIISRFSQESSQPYIDALERRGLKVRFITGQSGLQDFCFLMSAQKEMIGIAISTYFVWASYLSTCRRVVAYSLDTRERQRQDRPFVSYNFSNPDLQSRVQFVLIRPDAPPPAALAAESVEATSTAASSDQQPKSEPIHVGSTSSQLGPVDCSVIPRDPDPHIWLYNFTNFTAAVDRGSWSGRGTDRWSDEHLRSLFFPLLLNNNQSSSSRAELFVDVGANVGQMAMIGLVANYTTYAFDPLEYDVVKLCEGVRQNVERGYLLPSQAQNHFRLYRLVVGNTSRPAVDIYRPETRFGKFEQASLAGNTIGVATKPKLEVETVPMVRLDDVLPPDSPIGVVKINVQGTELLVVEGMRKILSRSTGYPHTVHYAASWRVTEGAGYRLGAVQELLEDYGYSCEAESGAVTCRKPRTAP